MRKMKKRNKTRGVRRAACLLISLLCGMSAVLLLPEASKRVAAQTEKESYELLVELGYGGEYASSRRVPIHVMVTSYAEDFVGTAEVLYADGGGDIINYKQDLLLPAGESKELIFYIKLPMGESIMTARLVDRNGKVAGAISQNLDGGNYNGMMMVGFLSDQEPGVYLNGTNGGPGCLELRPEDITNAADMGMLDVVVVNQFDLDSLEASQIQGLEEWVRLGGTLVLGTGSRYNQTLSVFSEDFLSGKVGDLREMTYHYREGEENSETDIEESGQESEKAKDTVEADRPASAETTFVEGEKEEEETGPLLEETLTYCPLTLTDAVSALEIEGETVLWKVPEEKGAVLVAAIDLQLPSWLQLSLGKELYQAIEHNLSVERARRIQEEQGGTGIYQVENALGQSNGANMPNISLYVLVLCLYVLVVGPVLYLVLRKLDKRHYMWLAVPAASLIFTGIVFLLGTPTRIREPYMSYVSYLDYGTEELFERTFFQLTAPYNRTYDVMVEKDYQIAQLRSWGYRDYATGTILSNYDVGIRKYEDGTDIELKNPSAFESFTFIAEGTAKKNGSYEAEVEVTEDGQVRGSFTNHLGYDLEKVVLTHCGSVFAVGDVADGETVELDGMKMDKVIVNDYYSINNTDFLERMFEYNYYREPDKARKFFALAHYLNNYGYLRRMETFLVGVAEQGTEENLTTDSEIENFGVTVPILPVENVTGNGYEYSIDGYATGVLQGSYDLPWSRYMSDSLVVCEYTFTDMETMPPKTIWYSALYNNELRGEGYDYFPGTISFLNRETGAYDLIFTGGIEGSCTDLSPYLLGGRLIVRYEVEEDQLNNNYNNLVIPVLSMTREVSADGTN